LKELVDSLPASEGLAAELFAVARLLDARPTVRKALADFSAPPDARRALAHGLFAGKLSASALGVAADVAAQRWDTPQALPRSFDHLGVRVLARAAERAGKLDLVESELLALRQLVAKDDRLRQALGDRTAPVASRLGLVRELVSGRVDGLTAALAEHAVHGVRGSYESRLDDALAVAAEVRSRQVAEVWAAKPLGASQLARLRAALAGRAGREVSVQLNLAPELLGGVRVRIGDEIIDGTASGRLTAARKALASA
jgi:F-type H+-transporting ATPase subunit delta